MTCPRPHVCKRQNQDLNTVPRAELQIGEGGDRERAGCTPGFATLRLSGPQCSSPVKWESC